MKTHKSLNEGKNQFTPRLDVVHINSQLVTPLIVFVTILWTGFVIIGYYFVHKPITSLQVLAILNVAGSFFAALVLTCFVGGLGDFVFPGKWLMPLERFAVQAALGTGLSGLIWLGVGLLKGYSVLLAWVLIILGLVLLRKHIFRWSNLLKEFPLLWQQSSLLGKILSLVGGFFVLVQLAYALAPPIQWDALTYHLELPRRYLEAGGFIFTSWNPYWGNPQLGEMIYTWAMALGGVRSALVFCWLSFSILLIGLLGSLVRHTSHDAAWVAVSSMLVGQSIRRLMSSAYVDGMAALIGYCALVCIIEWGECRDRRALLLSGIFAGIALFFKLTAGILIPALVLCLFVVEYREWKANVKRIAWFLLVATAIFFPWILICYFYTGNPIYPHFFSTVWTSSDRLAYFSGINKSFGLQPLFLPIAATWYGLDTVKVSGMPTYAADIGPLVLLFALPGMILGRLKTSIRMATSWLAVGWIGMVAGGIYSPLLWQTRLYLILLPAAVLLVGEGWDQLSRVISHGIRIRRVLAAVIFIPIVLNVIQDADEVLRKNPMQTWFHLDSVLPYLDRSLGEYPAAMQAVSDLPADSHTLFLWEPRGFYAPSNALPDSWIDRWYIDRRQYHEPGAILTSWKRQGFTHILLFLNGADFERKNRKELRADDWLALDELLRQIKLVESSGGAYELYEITP